MRWIWLAGLVGVLVAGCGPCFAQQEEPGWSVTTVTVANACGAPAAEVDKAAGFIAEWAARNLGDPSRLTKEKALAAIYGDIEINAIVKEKHAFIFPCDRWIYMLQLFNESKGAVMGGEQPAEAQDDDQQPMESQDWYSYDGQCWFKYAPPDSPISIANIEFTDGPSQSIEISLWVNVDELSSLGPRQENQCRFYEDLKGSIIIGGAKFAASQGGSTACDPAGDKIGANMQDLDINIVGNNSILSTVEALAAGASLQLTVENGPRRGSTFEIPTAGLKQAMKSISVCPSSVRDVLAK